MLVANSRLICVLTDAQRRQALRQDNVAVLRQPFGCTRMENQVDRKKAKTAIV